MFSALHAPYPTAWADQPLEASSTSLQLGHCPLHLLLANQLSGWVSATWVGWALVILCLRVHAGSLGCRGMTDTVTPFGQTFTGLLLCHATLGCPAVTPPPLQELCLYKLGYHLGLGEVSWPLPDNRLKKISCMLLTILNSIEPNDCIGISNTCKNGIICIGYKFDQLNEHSCKFQSVIGCALPQLLTCTSTWVLLLLETAGIESGTCMNSRSCTIEWQLL